MHDPIVRDFDIVFSNNLEETIKNAVRVLLMTKHNEYLKIDLNDMRSKVATPILIDGRNVFNAETAIKAGFIYKGIGKGRTVQRKASCFS